MKKIKIEFIPSDIIVIIGRKKFIKYVNKKGYNSTMPYDASTTIVTGDIHRIIIAIDGKACTDFLGAKALLVHEISHAVTAIFEHYGFSCDELRSYLMQYLYIEIIGYFDDVMISSKKHQ